MRRNYSKSRRNQTPDSRDSKVLVDDIVRYLSSLATLNEEEKIGNPELSRGLRHLVVVLRPYADSPISELSKAISEATDAGNIKTTTPKSKVALPSELESLDQEDIERILKDERYTKQQVAELGVRRFGMSRSKLTRLRKDDVLESVRAALGHEQSLDVISEAALRGGKARLN